jgi:acyl-CoA synthetase (NDP forming)
MSDLARALLRPESVALIGASDTAGRLTARPQTFMGRHGFKGRLYPVNPRRETVLGLKAYPNIAAIPERVDHAYILLDTDAAEAAVSECAAAGVRVVSVLADGFAEAGPEGQARQDRLAATAAQAGIALLGPNSMGVVETASGFACTTNAAFAQEQLQPGRVAVLSQSGSVIGAMLSRGEAGGRGFAAFVSTGNEAMLGVGEIGQALADDPGIDAFALFLETLRRPEEIAAFAAKARSLGKPVVAYLVGRSAAGGALAASHTGAMLGGGAGILAFLGAHGIVVAESFEGLLELPTALRLAPQLDGRPARATVVTTTGGGGGMVYDLMGLRGIGLQGMQPAAKAALAAQGIHLRDGPIVDVTLAGARYETMRAVMEALTTDPESGLVVAAIGSSARYNPELAVRPILDAHTALGDAAAPLLAVPIPDAPESLRLFNAGGVPAFRTVEACAEAVGALLAPPPLALPDTGAALPAATAAALAALPDGLLDEAESGAVLATLGLAQPPALLIGAESDAPAQLPFEGPYVLKAVSPDLAHKTEAGAVRLGLADAAAVAAALDEMRNRLGRTAPDAQIKGYLVQQMGSGLGEAVIGLTRDPVCGPLVSVGAGGTLAEIYADIATRPAPVTIETAQTMLAEVRGFAPLRGYRGARPGDLASLAKAVAALSHLALAPRVQEAEVNPVLVGEVGVMAVDALLHLASPR